MVNLSVCQKYSIRVQRKKSVFICAICGRIKISVGFAITSLWSVGFRQISCSKKNPCSSVCAKNIHRFNTRLYLFYVVFTPLEVLMNVKKSVTFIGKLHIFDRNATTSIGMQHLFSKKILYLCRPMK